MRLCVKHTSILPVAASCHYLQHCGHKTGQANSTIVSMSPGRLYILSAHTFYILLESCRCCTNNHMSSLYTCHSCGIAGVSHLENAWLPA